MKTPPAGRATTDCRGFDAPAVWPVHGSERGQTVTFVVAGCSEALTSANQYSSTVLTRGDMRIRVIYHTVSEPVSRMSCDDDPTDNAYVPAVTAHFLFATSQLPSPY